MPGFGLSIFTAILPVILMLVSTIVQLITGHQEAKNVFEQIIYFIGTAGTAMLISVIFAIFSMGLHRGRKMDDIMKSVTDAIYPIGMMILIIGGGGTFKQVLIDGGVGDTIAKMFEAFNNVTNLTCMDCRSRITNRIRLSNRSSHLNNRYRLTIITTLRRQRRTRRTRNRSRKRHPITRKRRRILDVQRILRTNNQRNIPNMVTTRNHHLSIRNYLHPIYKLICIRNIHESTHHKRGSVF